MTLRTVWTMQRQHMFALFQLVLQVSNESSLNFNYLTVYRLDLIVSDFCAIRLSDDDLWLL